MELTGLLVCDTPYGKLALAVSPEAGLMSIRAKPPFPQEKEAMLEVARAVVSVLETLAQIPRPTPEAWRETEEGWQAETGEYVWKVTSQDGVDALKKAG